MQQILVPNIGLKRFSSHKRRHIDRKTNQCTVVQNREMQHSTINFYKNEKRMDLGLIRNIPTPQSIRKVPMYSLHISTLYRRNLILKYRRANRKL
jgi:hypothetical protein